MKIKINHCILYLIVFSVIFILGCTQQHSKTTQGLGNLCTGEQCDEYCYNNSLECEKYCRENPSNEMCKERFSYVYSEQITTPKKPINVKGCEGKGTITFTHSPMKLEDLEIIQPMGLMIGGHVIPIDHQYYFPYDWIPELKEENLKDVYTPADGVVTSIERMPEFFNTAKGTNLGDYRLVIHHTCTFFTIYIHLRQLSPKLKDALGQKERINTPIKVNAGELIGRTTSFDFSAHNEDIILQGFIVPNHYDGEPWKIHTVDPFDYFEQGLKEKLLAKQNL